MICVVLPSHGRPPGPAAGLLHTRVRFCFSSEQDFFGQCDHGDQLLHCPSTRVKKIYARYFSTIFVMVFRSFFIQTLQYIEFNIVEKSAKFFFQRRGDQKNWLFFSCVTWQKSTKLNFFFVEQLFAVYTN